MVEQLIEAGILLAVGMSVVFAFLSLLIGGIHGIAWFANVFPQPQESENKYNKPKYNKNKSTPTTVDPTVVSAIAAAVHAHRRQGK